MSTTLPGLAATLLAAGALLVTASPPAQAESEGVELQTHENSHVVELKLMARRLMERVEDHRERLARLDNLIRYHRVRGQADEVRKLEALRQREVESFEQTLAEIHRLLGSQDFERISRAVRYMSNNRQVAEPSASSSELARTPAQEASASTSSAIAAATARTQASIERSVNRQLMLERSRASQQMQLNQRLKAARAEQLRLIAEQQRRFQPAAPTTASARRQAAGAAGATPPPANAGRRSQAAPYRRP